MSGECLISLVLSCCSKNLKQQTDQVYDSVLFGKQWKIHPVAVRAGWPKRHEEKRSEAQYWFLFLYLFPPALSLPYVNWDSQEACCFTWGSHSGPWTFLCSIFVSFSLLCLFGSVQFSRSAVFDSLWPYGLQHARVLSSPTLGIYSNSCPLSQWCLPTISSSVIPFFSHLQSSSVSGSFQMSQFFTSCGKYLSLSISPSNEHSGLSSFRMDWLDLLAVQGTLKSLLQHDSSKASILWHSAFL